MKSFLGVILSMSLIRVIKPETMKKNKLIAVVIFLVTAVGPFNYGMMNRMQPDMTTLVMFLLTLLGIGVGAFFFSKNDKSADQAA
jgi:hypothetical protein